MGLGGGDVGGGEAHQGQRVEARIGQLLGAGAHHVPQEAFADHGGREGVDEALDQGQGGLDRGDLVIGEATRQERRVIDAGGVG